MSSAKGKKERILVFVSRLYYDTWVTSDGVELRNSRRYTARPYVRYAVEYKEDGSIHRVLPWSRRLHDLLIGFTQPYHEDFNTYHLTTLELKTYKRLLFPSVIADPKQAKPLGSCDPAMLFAAGGTEEAVEEAKVLFEIRKAIKLRQSEWVSANDLPHVMTQCLGDAIRRLQEAGVILIHKQNYFAFQGASPLPVPPPVWEHPAPMKAEGVDFTKLAEMLKTDEKRRCLVISTSGYRALQPKGYTLVRLLTATEIFAKDEIVCLRRENASTYTASVDERTETWSVDFAHNLTAPAASASFGDLAHIKSSSKYDGVVVTGKDVPPMIIHKAILIAGSADNCVLVEC